MRWQTAALGGKWRSECAGETSGSEHLHHHRAAFVYPPKGQNKAGRVRLGQSECLFAWAGEEAGLVCGGLAGALRIPNQNVISFIHQH